MSLCPDCCKAMCFGTYMVRGAWHIPQAGADGPQASSGPCSCSSPCTPEQQLQAGHQTPGCEVFLRYHDAAAWFSACLEFEISDSRTQASKDDQESQWLGSPPKNST